MLDRLRDTHVNRDDSRLPLNGMVVKWLTSESALRNCNQLDEPNEREKWKIFGKTFQENVKSFEGLQEN